MTERKEAVKIVGRQYVVVKKDEFFEVGEVITLVKDDGSSNPWFNGDNKANNPYPQQMAGVMLLAETEAATPTKPQSVTEFVVGTVYEGTVAGTLQKQEDGSIFRLNTAKMFFSGSVTTESDDLWTVATAEQTAEFNKRKLQYQLDNLEVGEVYAVSTENHFICRYDETDSCGQLRGNHIGLGRQFPQTIRKNMCNKEAVTAIRPATASEIAELEAAEKEHGCEYRKPLINSKGTVIEEGQYYYTKEWDTTCFVTAYSGAGFYEIRLEDGVMGDKFFMDEINNPYCNALVPATQEQIAEFKAAEDAEAKANCKVKEGKQYKVTVKGTEITFEVYRVGRGCVTFKQQLVGGNEYLETLPIVSYIWETAVEVE